MGPGGFDPWLDGVQDRDRQRSFLIENRRRGDAGRQEHVNNLATLCRNAPGRGGRGFAVRRCFAFDPAGLEQAIRL